VSPITRSFIARDDAGRAYRLAVHADEPDGGRPDDARARLRGMSQIRTESGEPVRYRSRGRYELRSGMSLASEDPAAP